MANIDLSAPGIAKQVAKRISDSIDQYCQKAYDDGHRNHLGASLIGDDCKRKLWYGFRWVYKYPHDGRQLRLFNRGHREEERFIEWLEGAGFEVYYEDRKGLMYHPESSSYWIQNNNNDEGDGLSNIISSDDIDYAIHVAMAKAQGIKFPQFRVSGSNGHFGGSLDGIAKFPESWNIPGFVLLEFKTNGTGKSFGDLLATGMAANKPIHFAQTSTYGSDPNYKFKYVLYMNICKNDDNIHIELVELDWNLGDQMRKKADLIINSQTPPPKLSLDPTYWKCKHCDFLENCHSDKPSEKNCRSCIYARPVENAEWWCDLHSNEANAPIPKEVIKIGCVSYEDICKK